MKYAKYEKLERYVNGEPTGEFKKGALISVDEYASLEDCESGGNPMPPASYGTTFKIKTTSPNELVYLPGYANIEVTGGNFVEINNGIMMLLAGEYTIKLTLNTNVVEYPEQTKQILELDGILDISGYQNAEYICSGDTLFKDRTDLNEVFKDCVYLRNVADDIFKNCDKVTEMHNPFYGCSLSEDKIITIMSEINTLINADYILAGTRYHSACNILEYNPNLESINYAFQNMTGMENIPRIPTTIKSMNFAFDGCSNMTGTAPDLWNNTPAISGDQCFRGCVSLSNYDEIPQEWGGSDGSKLVLSYNVITDRDNVVTSLSISSDSYKIDWGDGTTEDTPGRNITHTYPTIGTYNIKITSLETVDSIRLYATSGCNIGDILTIGYLTDLADFANATSIGSNAYGICTSFNDLESKFSNKGRIISIADNLVTDKTVAKSLESTFYRCTSLQHLPDFLTTLSNVTTVKYMAQSSGITSLPSDLFINMPNITDFSYCFDGCTNLIGSTPIDGNGYKLWERAGKPGYPATINGTACFRECTQLDDYDAIPSDWK